MAKKTENQTPATVTTTAAPKSRRVVSKLDKKLTLTEAWYKVLSDNFKARKSDAELEAAFSTLMGGRPKVQPAARIRGFFNSENFPYFRDLGLKRPSTALPKFEGGKPTGKKSVVAAYVALYGTEAEKAEMAKKAE